MQPFEDYFSDEAIIKALVNLRCKKAQQRHKLHFRANFNHHRKTHQVRYDPELYSCLPPRRQWKRPPKAIRGGKNSLELNRISLRHTTLAIYKSETSRNIGWLTNLRRIVAEIRDAALVEIRDFARPKIVPKDKGGGEYRPISNFAIKESVIYSLAAKYLRDLLDPNFSESSFAFRSKSPQTLKVPTHHDAVHCSDPRKPDSLTCCH